MSLSYENSFPNITGFLGRQGSPFSLRCCLMFYLLRSVTESKAFHFIPGVATLTICVPSSQLLKVLEKSLFL